MSIPQPSIPPGPPVAAIPVDKSSSLWDRVSTWASENKAAVYTIAGVAVVVTGAGIVYYLNSPVRDPDHPTLLSAASHSLAYRELCPANVSFPLTSHNPKRPVLRRRSGERGRRPRGKLPRRKRSHPNPTPRPRKRAPPNPPPSSLKRTCPPSTRPPSQNSPPRSATSMRIG